MANLQWSGISDNVDTGATVEAKLNTSFSNAELAITAAEDGILSLVESLSTFAVLSGQNIPSYDLATTTQGVDGYSDAYVGNFMASVPTSGIITPTNTGWYQVTYTGDISFTSVSSTRSITLSLFDGATEIASSVINIPRDATRDSESLSMMVNLTGGNGYSIGISASTSMDITFNTMQFSIRRVG